MRVSEGIIETLARNGIDTVFGNPGKQTLPLNEAIGERDDISFVIARHETAVSHEAWGYAETSGRMAATVVIPGPGDMNAMNGLKNALNDCTPLLHVAVETEPELRGGDGIHETPPDTYDNVVKENVLVETPQSTIAEIERAIAVAQTPPKGPVRVGVPKNFLKLDVPIAASGTYSRERVTDLPDEEIGEAVDRLAGAERPVVVAGGGVRASNASEELRAVAERLDAPVITTMKGKGVLPEDHRLSAGVLSISASDALLDCLAESDVVLGVGTDFDAVATQGWSVDLPGDLVHVTLDPDDIGTGYEPAVGIVGDAALALATIDERLAARGHESQRDGAGRTEAVRAATEDRIEDLLDASEPPLTSVSALRAVREALPRDAIVAVDAGGFRIWTLAVFAAYGPRSYVNPGSWASMGTGLPSAIGAAVANPDERVIALTGDGGLMMCLHELHTVVNEGLDVVTVVFNNDDYAIISEEAARSYGLGEGAYDWAETPVSFTAIADGVGMDAVRAETSGELERAVNEALDADEATLIEVPTDPREPQAGVHMRD